MAELKLVARGSGSGDKGKNKHGCSIEPYIHEKSGTVFVGGVVPPTATQGPIPHLTGVARHTDQMVPHFKLVGVACVWHPGKSTGKDTTAASPEIETTEEEDYKDTTVFVEGLPIARMDDKIVGTSPTSCGKIKTINQTTVWAGK